MSFIRAKPERAVLNISDELNAKIDERAITLINPHLNVMYITSNDVEQQINRLKGHSLSYPDYPLKNIVLSEGLTEYNVNLINGKIYFFK